MTEGGLRQASRTRSISLLGLGSEYTCMFTLEKLMGPLICVLYFIHVILQQKIYRDSYTEIGISQCLSAIPKLGNVLGW